VDRLKKHFSGNPCQLNRSTQHFLNSLIQQHFSREPICRAVLNQNLARAAFGPVTNGLRNSPTGSKDRYIQVLATRLVIASTGAMLIVGHEAPCRLSALACRIESPDHTGKEGNSRQVSGTSDASKTQLGLIRS
jgi:hypothetical protein